MNQNPRKPEEQRKERFDSKPPYPDFLKEQIHTLDETILESLYRDLKQILIRTKYVVFPFGKGSRQLRKWDLWGPLILCIVLSWTLSYGAPPQAANEIFGTVFCLVWVGAGIVTLNAQLLKGKVSFFHCVCTLGYSLFPMNISSFICVLFKNSLDFGISTIIIILSFLWSFKAANLYMERLMGDKTKGLSLYPVFLFYIFLAFFIFQMTHS